MLFYHSIGQSDLIITFKKHMLYVGYTLSAFFFFFYENPSIRTTETRFSELERLSTPAKPSFSNVFTKTAGRHNLVQPLWSWQCVRQLVFPFYSRWPRDWRSIKVHARWMLRMQHSTTARHCWEYYFSSYCGGNSFSCKVSNRSPKERRFLTCNEWAESKMM